MGGTASAQHVVIVVFENQDYGSVVGNTTHMPFFNSLANQHALATQFYANAHGSIGNYFELTTGQNPTGNNDNYSGPFSGDNVVQQLTSAGKTWKVYAQSLPSVGYTGGDAYPYVKHHNPFAYFSNVVGTSQASNIVPFSQFATDVANNSLPAYSFIVPDNLHNGHDCSDGTQNCALAEHLTNIDSFLSSNFSSILQNPTFLNSSILIVTFDESATDNTNGGGRIAVLLAGSAIKTNFSSTTMYQFPSMLKFSLNSIGVNTVPGDGASAPSMSEFLK